MEHRLFENVSALSDWLCNASRKIWENPEIGYQEVFASSLSQKMLKEIGFEVEDGYAGVPTAYRAIWGSGHPIVGFLAEYDALPGQSQKDVPYKEPVKEGECGHGCGHNLIAIQAIGTAAVLKKEMEENGLQGTLVVYGCPGEELLTGKGFMARGGAFRELDCAFAWHPGRYTRASYSVLTGVNSFKFHYTGKTAHAAVEPDKGRSALDAVELMNIGCNYLREHVPMDVRIHYCITEGGTAPNIVPDKATVWYYDRALKRETMKDVEARILRIAQGAAMMTDTEFEVESLGGCYPSLPNHVLADLIDECMREVPQESWTEEEIEYARKINMTDETTWKECVKFSESEDEDTQIYSGVMPIDTADDYGSSDIGDVGHIVPTTFYKTACYGIAAPGHSWQIAACLGNSIGQKGMLYAIKVTALAVLKLIEKPEIVQSAKEEFTKSMGNEVYECMIPAETLPPAPLPAK